METYITVKELAKELGVDRSNCRKIVKSLSISPFPVRIPGQRGSPLIAITAEEADIVRQDRVAKGFTVGKRSEAAPAQSAKTDDGSFYVISLDPEARPNRLKFGFASNVMHRLSEHRCAAPCAELLASWPAKRCWEACIMDALTVGAQKVSGEVFDVPDVSDTLAKGHQFMGMLPSLGE